jgi:hypothetical protein
MIEVVMARMTRGLRTEKSVSFTCVPRDVVVAGTTAVATISHWAANRTSVRDCFDPL